MSLMLANLVFAVGICLLFYLDRDPLAKTSKALWIPVAWLFLSGSRPFSLWLADFGLTSMPAGIDSPDQYLDGSPIDRLVYITLLVLGLIALSARKRRVWSLLRSNSLILLFFFYCAISVLWSDYPLVAFKRWIKSAGDPIMVMIILTDFGGIAALKRVFARTAFLLIPISVLYIKYHPDLGRGYNRWSYLPSYTGITLTKNMLGMVCLVFGLGVLWCFIAAWQHVAGKERKRRLIAHGVVLAMTFWLFWMANSVTSLVCFALAASLMVAVSFFETARKPLFLHSLVTTSAIVPLMALFSGSGAGIIESLGRDSSLTGRTAIWQAVLSVSGSPLFGTGFESFWMGDRLQKVWDMTAKGIQEAHNGYLEVYLNLGFIGLGLIIIMLVVGYRHVIAELPRDPIIGSLKLAYFVVAVVYNLSEAGFRELSLTWITFLVAITLVPSTPVPDSNFSPKLPPLKFSHRVKLTRPGEVRSPL